MAKQKLQQNQQQKLSPQQIQFLGLLQTPIISLERRIEEELEDNPALEEEEDEIQQYYNKSSNTNYEKTQITDNCESLSSYLIKQLSETEIKSNILFLAKYIINSLDDNGFLKRDLYSIQSDLLVNNNLTVKEDELMIALKIVQSLEPYGVGAKNLKECILIQLNKLHKENDLALIIISEHYTPFSNKNFEYLISNLNITKTELKKIYELIKNLNPIPSLGFSKYQKTTEYIYPDFEIRVSDNEIKLQLKNSNVKEIKVSKYYSDLLANTKDKETIKFLKHKVDKATWFKEAIIRRQITLRKVMLAIIELQKNYFLSGNDSDLQPMKLADIAKIVNMDISTISRVSNSKYIETQFGTFKVKELFSDAYRKDNGEIISTKEIKNKLRDIILNENKEKPYTDEELTHLLGENEYHIARRTISKYRDQLSIKSAKLRRELK